MIMLQKGNVQKIVASKNQADKLVSVGFEVIESKSEKALTAAEKKALAKAEAGDDNETAGANTNSNQNGAKTE